LVGLIGGLSLAVSASAFGATAPVQQFSGASPLEWSKRMADSEMARRTDTMFHGGSRERARWDYTTSLFGLSLLKLAERTGNNAYADYGAKTVETFVQPDGSIATYNAEDYNIDMIPPGKVMLLRYEQGHRDPKFKTAIETLYAQLQKQPRTSEGGFGTSFVIRIKCGSTACSWVHRFSPITESSSTNPPHSTTSRSKSC
jgi:unsaturated rhamnogalacturonyl hydrolase